MEQGLEQVLRARASQAHMRNSKDISVAAVYMWGSVICDEARDSRF